MTSPLLLSPNPLPSYVVIIYILLVLLCSASKYLSRIISFCLCFTGKGVQSICYFYLCLLFSFSSSSVAPDTSLFPFPFSVSFCKGLSCVLYPNPFKILCPFLNDGNLLTRQKDERAGRHIRRTCYVCCDNREEMLWLAPLKAPVLCFWQRGREGGDLNCWSCSALLLSPARIALPLSRPSFWSLSSPSLPNSWRKGKIAEGFAENYAAHIKTGTLPFPEQKTRS